MGAGLGCLVSNVEQTFRNVSYTRFDLLYHLIILDEEGDENVLSLMHHHPKNLELQGQLRSGIAKCLAILLTWEVLQREKHGRGRARKALE